MFRRSLLPCAWLSVALGFAVIAAPAWSQDRSTQERLDRLERDLNMLQRQVYRGAPPPPIVGGDGGAAVNAEIRMGRLEAQMRDLTGRVEEFINQIEQVRQRVEQVAGDIEERVSQGGAGAGPRPAVNLAPTRPGPAAPARPTRQLAAEPPRAPDEDLPSRQGSGAATGPAIPPGTAVPPPGAAAPVFGTLTPPGALSAGPEVATAAPAGRSAGGLLSGGSAAEQYNQAFGLLKQADYPAAEAALKTFVEQHPTDPMAGNAQYWLGETYYARRDYQNAMTAFAEGYKVYKGSPKGPDNLLKLGVTLAVLGRKPDACAVFAKFNQDYPRATDLQKRRVEQERQKNGCG